MRRRAKQLEADVHHLADLMDKVDRKVDRIELATVVREPATPVAADAYNGLRKQVIAAVSERNAHLHQLAQFGSALSRGASTDDLAALVREWLGQASMTTLADPSVAEAFELVGPVDAAGRRVLEPAYVDQVTNRVVRQGVVERFHEEAGDAAPEAGAEDGPDGSPEPAMTDDDAAPADEAVGTTGGQQ